MTTENPTACLLIIGNEVLSGRTRDANLQFLATRLGELGIPMREARVIPDVPEASWYSRGLFSQTSDPFFK